MKAFSHNDDMNAAAPAGIPAKPVQERGKRATGDKGRERERGKIRWIHSLKRGERAGRGEKGEKGVSELRAGERRRGSNLML